MRCDYTQAELTDMAAAMRRVANGIYPQLVACGRHPFIEFCGLMQKYVDVCERAAERGIQFPFASGHCDTPLPVEPHDLLYLAEKLECIFAPMVAAKDRARAVFAKALLGIDV